MSANPVIAFLDAFTDPFSTKAEAWERRDLQWKAANAALEAAGEHIAAENYQAAIATSLTGLLALKLSDQ